MSSSRDLAPRTESFFPTIFWKNQFRSKPTPIPPETSLIGKIAIVTGANVGLGYECSRQLLDLNLSHLILAVRSKSRGDDAAAKLRKAFPKAIIEVWLLDMASYASIEAFAARVAQDLKRLDIAILNAGVMNLKFQQNSETGHEDTVQINYLSTVLLALLMLPILKNKSRPAEPGRLTIVGAALALVAKPPFMEAGSTKPASIFGCLDNAKAYNGQEWYHTSKVMMHMFLWKLAEQIPSSDHVVVNVVDPGWVRGTSLARDVPGIIRIAFRWVEMLLARTLKDGASTYVDAAVLKGSDSHGCFVMGWKISPFAAILYTPEGKEVIERLWEETMSELSFANPQEILDKFQST